MFWAEWSFSEFEWLADGNLLRFGVNFELLHHRYWYFHLQIDYLFIFWKYVSIEGGTFGMNAELLISYLIVVHASLGGLALLSGFSALLARKGNRLHKISGLIFYFSMLASAFFAMIVAVLPGHENLFLFAIGVFSGYFVLAGRRSLSYRWATNFKLDKVISGTMLVFGLVMILGPIVLKQKINIVSAVLGIVGLLFAIRDFQLFRKPEHLKKSSLKLHIGKMIGGYISAVTAFVVVNDFFQSIWGWFVPGILGGFLIAYWLRRVGKSES